MRQKLAVNGYLLEKERLKGRGDLSGFLCRLPVALAIVLAWFCGSVRCYGGTRVFPSEHRTPFYTLLLTEIPHLIFCPSPLLLLSHGTPTQFLVRSVPTDVLFNKFSSTDQSSSLLRILYLSTHPNSQRIFLCFCGKVTRVDSITFLITIIHFQQWAAQSRWSLHRHVKSCADSFTIAIL